MDVNGRHLAFTFLVDRMTEILAPDMYIELTGVHQAALPLKGLIYILYIFFSFRVLVCLTVFLGHSTDSTDVILSCCVQVTREKMWRKVEKVCRASCCMRPVVMLWHKSWSRHRLANRPYALWRHKAWCPRGMLVLVVIARENFNSGHFELFNFPRQWLLRPAFLTGLMPYDVIMHKV